MTLRTTIAAAALLSLPLLAGCADDSVAEDATTTPAAGTATPDPTSETPSVPTSVPTSDPTSAPPDFPDGTGDQAADGTGAGLVLVDVRPARRDGYDRVVLEFSGKGTPGWVLDYVDRARLEGSGDVVDVDGAATLQVFASGTTWPAPDYYSGPTRLTPQGGGAGGVAEVHVAGTFEGYTQVFVGIDDGPVPFRAFTLTSPSRLVIDVQDTAAD
ncbi:AMIN-like domain-containing (lipo)protein [Nocardioides dongxiaopingii]|uniref:AMIN-like domain-containing (lipo)protein n=1 Tax=Nocardioides dongxiaopingii TaxID=2576036 RepID=UPI0010C7705C|nr:hypothetical protein [Nocardioides dongxiaopingii]